MIVEIGTSDFRTMAGVEHGLFVEPVKEHFNRLGECLKENVAVSNYEGDIDIYYIPTKDIEDRGLPYWVRGCNSVNAPHPSLVRLEWFNLIKKDTVKVVRIKSLLDKHNITEITTLKIDTEGHDCIILNDFFDTCDILPRTIKFEYNSLSDPKEVSLLLNRVKEKGYKYTTIKDDIVCELL